MRRLNADERAIWARVAGTVRPLSTARPVRSETSDDDFALLIDERQPPSRLLPSHPIVTARREAQPRQPATPANTLDGSWDKRIRLGQIEPDVWIDLHGETLSSAHARLNRSLAAAIRSEARVILLITGRPPRDNPRLPPQRRGIIRASVGDWLAASPFASRIAAVRNAHPRHGGAGALYLILRRAR